MGRWLFLISFWKPLTLALYLSVFCSKSLALPLTSSLEKNYGIIIHHCYVRIKQLSLDYHIKTGRINVPIPHHLECVEFHFFVMLCFNKF